MLIILVSQVGLLTGIVLAILIHSEVKRSKDRECQAVTSMYNKWSPTVAINQEQLQTTHCHGHEMYIGQVRQMKQVMHSNIKAFQAAPSKTLPRR
eukprot:1152806-Pelagomonas_calceolata.AAC.5